MREGRNFFPKARRGAAVTHPDGSVLRHGGGGVAGEMEMNHECYCDERLGTARRQCLDQYGRIAFEIGSEHEQPCGIEPRADIRDIPDQLDPVGDPERLALPVQRLPFGAIADDRQPRRSIRQIAKRFD